MLVCAFSVRNCTRDRGCSAHPVFPAPSFPKEGCELTQSPDASRRGNADPHLSSCLTIESEVTSDRAPIRMAQGVFQRSGTGSRQENASNQKSRALFRYHRNG